MENRVLSHEADNISGVIQELIEEIEQLESDKKELEEERDKLQDEYDTVHTRMQELEVENETLLENQI